MRQQVRIRKGTHLGSLKPVLLSKHLTETESSIKSVPSRIQPYQNTHSLTLAAPQQPSFSPKNLIRIMEYFADTISTVSKLSHFHYHI